MGAGGIASLPLDIRDEEFRLFDFERDLPAIERRALARRNGRHAAIALRRACTQRQHKDSENRAACERGEVEAITIRHPKVPPNCL